MDWLEAAALVWFILLVIGYCVIKAWPFKKESSRTLVSYVAFALFLMLSVLIVLVLGPLIMERA